MEMVNHDRNINEMTIRCEGIHTTGVTQQIEADCLRSE